MARVQSDAQKRLRTAAAELGRFGSRRYSWRRRPTPFRTLLAEVLLQHTPASRVEPVFDEVVTGWPTFAALAAADPAELADILRPLGLHRRRAQSLVELAKIVNTRWSGHPPGTQRLIAELPGVGPYSSGLAAAVAGEPASTYVDGGIARMLKRYFGITSTRRAAYDPDVASLASAVLPGPNSRHVAWGMIDLAREVCRVDPLCQDCPVSQTCNSRRHE